MIKGMVVFAVVTLSPVVSVKTFTDGDAACRAFKAEKKAAIFGKSLSGPTRTGWVQCLDSAILLCPTKWLRVSCEEETIPEKKSYKPVQMIDQEEH